MFAAPCLSAAPVSTDLSVNDRQPVTLTLQLVGADRQQPTVNLVTLSGQPVMFADQSAHPYVASRSTWNGVLTKTRLGTFKTGWHLQLTPVVQSDGHIAVAIDRKHTSLESLDHFRYGAQEIDLPNLRSSEVLQKVAVEPGEAVLIPIGPLTPAGQPAYQLKLTASIGADNAHP